MESYLDHLWSMNEAQDGGHPVFIHPGLTSVVIPNDISTLKWAVANSGRYGVLPTAQNLVTQSEEESFLKALLAKAVKIADKAFAVGTITSVKEYREFIKAYIADHFKQEGKEEETEPQQEEVAAHV